MQLPSADLVRAELYADSLRDYIPAAWPLAEQRAFKSNWHIDVIAEHLEALSRREIRRLIINIPPRHMKSLSVAVFWPSWEWLRHPETQFMFASYAQRLTTRDSLKCRRVVESNGGMREGSLMQRVGYQGVLKLIEADWTLASDQREKLRFENTEFGYRLGTSIGGTGTGEGGDMLVVDDPHKADEAESEVERENVIEWIDGTLSTRLNDPATGCVLLVMQRLHEKDATGHLVEQGGYVHLCLPAEYEAKHPFVWPDDPRTQEGELLWPEHFTREAIDELKKRLGSYRAAGQLQQRPAPAEGILFKRKDFRYYTEEWVDEARYYVLHADDGSRRFDAGQCIHFQISDVAASEKQTADYTVCTTLALAPEKDLLVLEVERQHFEILEVGGFLGRKSDEWNRIPLYVEHFGHGTGPVKWLRRNGYPVRKLEANHGANLDKIARSLNAQIHYENHKIFHPKERTDWREEFEAELTTFPNGANDDQVDTISYAGRVFPLLGASTPSKPVEDRPKPISAGVRRQQF